MRKILRAINCRIVDFKDWRSKATLANVATWFGGAIGLVVSFSGGFDWVVPRLIAYLAAKPELVPAWANGHHWGAKIAISALILVFFYLLSFSIQAAVLLSERQPADYRAEITKAIGVSFARMHDYYDVINDGGDCYVSLEADVCVGDFALSHVERKYGSHSATGRGTPKLEVPVHPPNVRTDVQHSPATTALREYHFRFVPPLSHTSTTTTVKVTEQVTRGVWMWLEDVPEDRVLGGRLESIGHFVQEPTELLILEVHFPRFYTVTGERLFKVRLGSTENPHTREEQRLENANALEAVIDKDRQKLRLTVQQPLLGLCYYLCWVPPKKS